MLRSKMKYNRALGTHFELGKRLYNTDLIV